MRSASADHPRRDFDRARALFVACAVVVCGCQKKPEQPVQPPPPEERSDSAPATAVLERPLELQRPVAMSAAGSLAFVREIEGRRETWVVDADGENARRLPEPAIEGDLYPASASANGRYLVGVVATGEEPAHREQLVVWDLQAGTAKAIGPASPRTRHPVISPDGARIVFESGAQSFADIFVIGIDGAGLKRLTSNNEGNFDPSWSPDGKQVVFASSRDGDPEIYRMRADGEGEERLTAFHLEDTSPRFSPATLQVSFISNREGEDAVFVMAPDGTGQRRVIPKARGAEPNQQREVAWSADGKRLAFVERLGPKATRLWVADLASGKSWPASAGKSVDDMPAWSGDGNALYFVSDRSGRAQLYRVQVDGSGERRVLSSETTDWLPVWIPAPGAR